MVGFDPKSHAAAQRVTLTHNNAQAHAAAGGRTYLYEFCWDATTIGAAHTVEIPAVFGTLDSPYGDQLYGTPPPPRAVALSDDMGRAWRSFAANGDPGWPRYDATDQLTRVFGAESTVVRYPEQVSPGDLGWPRVRAVPAARVGQ